MYIEISLKRGAYTPEAFAYKEYLSARGHSIRLCNENEMSPAADVRIYFMGMRPWWSHGRTEHGKVIHEYQSLSVPPLSALKDWSKRMCNASPAGRIFLNSSVHTHLRFRDSIPYLYRDMGVSRNLYGIASANPDYDLLYCGSLNNRPGLANELIRLSALGLRLLVVGSVTQDITEKLRHHRNIHLTGALSRDQLPEVFSRVRAGLNYTPDRFPFNIQTSTKTLEYCASGIGLVSNRYQWIKSFSKEYNFKPLWLDQIKHRDDFDNFVFNNPDVSALEWENILSSSGFETFIASVANAP